MVIKKKYKIDSKETSFVQNTIIKDMIGKNTLSDALKAKYMRWEPLLTKLKKEWSDTTYDARALTAFYTLFAPRRTQGYSLMKVIRKASKKVTDASIRDLNTNFSYIFLNKKNWPSQFIRV